MVKPSAEFYEEEFVTGALIPERWISQALRLKRAGDLLFEASAADLERFSHGEKPSTLKNLEMVMPATLLYGMALENALKGRLVHQQPNRIVNGKLRAWPGGSHNLNVLADAARVTLSQEEEDLLRRLTQFVLWAGRYPTPRRAEDMRLEQLVMPGGFLPMPIDKRERPLYDSLFSRLVA